MRLNDVAKVYKICRIKVGISIQPAFFNPHQGHFMSAVVFHIIDAPAVLTPNDAEAFLIQERQKPPSINPKFAMFRAAITQQHPDLSDDDDDGDNDKNIWEEGLSDESSCGDVKTIALKIDLVDEAILQSIIGAAIASGLQCYDDEGQILYRADEQAIDLHGHVRTL
jgi:hypothetical protein